MTIEQALAELSFYCGPGTATCAAWDWLRADEESARRLTRPDAWEGLRGIRGLLSYFDVESLGCGTNPRPLTVDHELVPFFDLRRAPPGQPTDVLPEGTVADFTLVMHSTPDGWLVCGIEVP